MKGLRYDDENRNYPREETIGQGHAQRDVSIPEGQRKTDASAEAGQGFHAGGLP